VASKKNICPWCGIVNPEEAVECQGCGSDLRSGQASSGAVRSADAGKPELIASPTPGSESGKQGAENRHAPAHQGKANRIQAKTARKQDFSKQIRPGYVYAAIAAVVILGYLYLNNDKTEPVVPQNTALVETDSSAQRISSMEQFLESNPQDSKATLEYANMLHDARQFPKAIAAYKKFLVADPKNADARVDMAICLFESGDSPTAIVELKKALEYAPKHQPAMFNLGVVYLNQNKVQESNDWFSRCAAVDPGTPIAARAKQLLSQHSSTNQNLK
jgi:tetratricopeptide (TPR) repeat protein